MDKLRRSIRQSFRRRNSRDFLDDASKPHQWQKDEAAVRAGTCSFSVKYLGCVEVFESRGMQVCEEALKVLRNNRRKTIRGFLYVSGDGLRVVDADNKGLVVDQTIEKVSFCAPDRNNDKGFAYICRDGTTRRWMCHGFLSAKDSGERLSHAVGCAFAVCLEHKQKRDREAVAQTMAPTTDEKSTPKKMPQSNVNIEQTVSDDARTSGFSATNPLQASFRRASLAERKQDPQNVIPAEKPPVKQISHPNAVARPPPNRALFERQGSLRMPASAVTNLSANNIEQSAQTFQRFNSLRLGPASSDFAIKQAQTKSKLNGNTSTVSAIWEGEEDALAASSELTASSSNQPYVFAHCINSSIESQPQSNGDRLYATDNYCSSIAGPTTSGNGLSFQAKSKGEEWLTIAANQAKLLKQQRDTPPIISTAALNPSPVPPTFHGAASSLPPSYQSSSSSSINANSPRLPPFNNANTASYINDGLQTASLSSNGADSPSSAVNFSPVKMNSVQRPATNYVSHTSDNINRMPFKWRPSASFDVASSRNTALTLGSDQFSSFDDKWDSLNTKQHFPSTNANGENAERFLVAGGASTNPFTQESSAVHI